MIIISRFQEDIQYRITQECIKQASITIFLLAYPDWGFGNILYFLRIRANLFYDFTQTKSLRTGNRYNFSSTGAEIFFDTKWWNQQQVSFGIRYSRLLNDDFEGKGPNQWEIVLPLNL